MTLEQSLAEVEPVFRQVGDSFSFNHPSFQEILTAKQFADEINSGRLSVRDAYVNFWSYVEDAELWGLPKDREWRAVLPAWRTVFTYMAEALTPEKRDEFIRILTESYCKAQRYFSEREYNPFYVDTNTLDQGIIPNASVEPEQSLCGKMTYKALIGLFPFLEMFQKSDLDDADGKIRYEFASGLKDPKSQEWRDRLFCFSHTTRLGAMIGIEENAGGATKSDMAALRRYTLTKYYPFVLVDLIRSWFVKGNETDMKYGLLDGMVKLGLYDLRFRAATTLKKVHKSLQPQGYNPAVKRLAV